MGLVGWILAKADTSVSQAREQMSHTTPAPQFLGFEHLSGVWEPHFSRESTLVDEPDEFSSQGAAEKTGRALLKDLQALPVLPGCIYKDFAWLWSQQGCPGWQEEGEGGDLWLELCLSTASLGWGLIHLQQFLTAAATGLLSPASSREPQLEVWKRAGEQTESLGSSLGAAQTTPGSHSQEGNKEIKAQRGCATGVFGSCDVRQCCQKPFWDGIFPAVCVSLRARVPGRAHGAVSQLSPGWQAPPSAPWQEKPWQEVWEEQAGSVLCVCRYCRKLSACVSSKPPRGCFYGSAGQQEETKPSGVPKPPSFLTGLLGMC